MTVIFSTHFALSTASLAPLVSPRARQHLAALRWALAKPGSILAACLASDRACGNWESITWQADRLQ